jgi:hypothetical protein
MRKMKLLMLYTTYHPSSFAPNKRSQCSTMSSSLFRVAAAVLLVVSSFDGMIDQVRAEFGDTVDPTFNCPALTTCAQVCVATVEDCPPEMACPGNTTTLCADGSCAEECEPAAGDDDGAEGLVSPCAFECAPVACNRVDNTFDQCTALYGDLYDAEVVCGEEESAYESTLLEYTEPAFIIGYVWVTGLTFCIIFWCAYKYVSYYVVYNHHVPPLYLLPSDEKISLLLIFLLLRL